MRMEKRFGSDNIQDMLECLKNLDNDDEDSHDFIIDQLLNFDKITHSSTRAKNESTTLIITS